MPYVFQNIDPRTIIVQRETRQRRDPHAEDLVLSIKQNGIIQPLVVTEALVLVAGERRLTAALELGLPIVPVRVLETLSPLELQIIELEENVKRRDLEWQERCRATASIHELFCVENPDWSQSRTAEAVGLSEPYISRLLRVHSVLHEPMISGASTLNEAFNILRRREDREAGDLLQELLVVGEEVLPTQRPVAPVAGAVGGGQGPAVPMAVPNARTTPVTPPAPKAPPPPSCRIIQADFHQWLTTPEGIAPAPKYNFIHCDFPYGINVFSGKQMSGDRHGEYEDTPDVYFDLIRALCAALPQIASLSCHVMFWYSAKLESETRKLFAEGAPQLQWHPYPLIWHKTDNAGIAGDSQRHHRHVYETALIGSIGQRPLVRTASDCYGAPTAKLLHASTKPEPMLRHFFSTIIDRNSRVLDPTCGSGASIRAADSLGAQSALGLEIDGEFASRAQTALVQAQRLRASGL